MSSVATRPRSMTAHSSTSLTSAPFQNFRPIRYQTREEIDRFFGTTSAQKREQRLRVREPDGQVYFDWIEKDEWQHLLASGSLTSPQSPAGEGERRRSSVATLLTLNSPLREHLVSPSTPGLSPLAKHFGDVGLGEIHEERRGRKRSSSQLALAAGRNVVDEDKAMGESVFKRRQSDGSVFNSRDVDMEAQEEGKHEDRIRTARLPLSHRKLNQEALDQAFGAQNPLLDLSPSPNATLYLSSGSSRTNKPAALHLPSSIPTSQIEEEGDGCASPLTFECGTRRGTFGSLFPPLTPVQILAASPKRMRHQSDVGTPPSSAAMEYLASPAPITANSSNSASQSRTLRHAVSFDTPRPAASLSSAFVLQQPPEKGPWAQRQRWHSAEKSDPQQKEKSVRTVRSFASLREPLTKLSDSDRVRKMSNSSDGSSFGSDSTPCWTPLAPRTGAKKFDRTRLQHLNSLPTPSPSSTPPPSNIALAPMKDPIVPTAVQSPPAEVKQATRGVGLRTGPEVYEGIDIPCPSIHLHSDPEDNFEPALVLSMSARELKKKKKSTLPLSATNNTGPAQHARSASSYEPSISTTAVHGHAKGSSRWWNTIRHS